MPGVLMVEAFSQVATLLLVQREGSHIDRPGVSARVDNAKFRRQGSCRAIQLRLDVIARAPTRRAREGPVCGLRRRQTSSPKPIC